MPGVLAVFTGEDFVDVGVTLQVGLLIPGTVIR
ncbi:MAG: hypothetical protein CM15mP85_27470 [Rhodobacterales bacterium]|nr:MAG: hypothetical protein CM15mP85_27470 [Rhodobacterales bacterium]